MEEHIQLTSFGKKKIDIASTETTPNGIDTATPNVKVGTESNNNRVDQPKEASDFVAQTDSRGYAGETEKCNSLIHETAIDIPEPPPPPPIQASVFDQPPTSCVVGTEATADIIDIETLTSKDEESITGTAKPAGKEQALTPAPAVSPGYEESNSMTREQDKSSTPIKLSTFSPLLSEIDETFEATSDGQNAQRDETAKPVEEPKSSFGTSATQDPVPPSTGETTITSLLNEAEAKPSTTQSKSTPEPDDPAGIQNVDAVVVLDKGSQSIEIELGPAADELGPAPVGLADEAVDSNSQDSGMKLASFDTELDTMFVKRGDQERKFGRAQFVVLCSMALATVMLIAVAVGLVLLMTYEDISKILGKSGKPTVAMQMVTMNGEAIVKGLQFNSSYSDPKSEDYKTLQSQFILSIEDILNEIPHRGVYRSTGVSKFRNGSVIVDFLVTFKPMRKPDPSEDQTSGREVYKKAKKFLELHLPSVMINGKTYNVSVIKLTLVFGKESVPEEPSTTKQPQVSTIRFPSSDMTTTRDQMMSSTAGQSTASVRPTTSEQLLTTRASTSAAPMSTGYTSGAVTDINQTTTFWDQNTTNHRHKRSTRFTDMSTTRLVTKQSSDSLTVSLTPNMTDDITEGCFSTPYQTCVLFGLSPNVTRTPNRFGLGHNTSRFWNQFNDELIARNMTSWRVVCSLLAPTCDGSLIGTSLPCRSACLAVVGLLSDTIEMRRLGALCNESLPESESETICFKSANQDQTYTPPTGSPCSALSCQNGGSCFDMDNRAYCRCPEGFGGRRCEIDPCTPNPCQNGAVCRGHAEFIISYVCGCTDGYHGTHCQLSTAEPLSTHAPRPQNHVPLAISEPGCRALLPYNQTFSDPKVPDWRLVAPLASCGDEARLIFCAMAYPEFEPRGAADRRRRAPCRALCERVFVDCGAFFAVMGREFPGICERLGTIPTEAENFCTGPYP